MRLAWRLARVPIFLFLGFAAGLGVVNIVAAFLMRQGESLLSNAANLIVIIAAMYVLREK